MEIKAQLSEDMDLHINAERCFAQHFFLVAKNKNQKSNEFSSVGEWPNK